MRRDGRMAEALGEYFVEVEGHGVHRAGGEELALSLRQRPPPMVPVDFPYLEVLVVPAALDDSSGTFRSRCHLGHA